jgi:hypothetical protein
VAGSNLLILPPLGKGLNDPAPKNAGWNYLHGKQVVAISAAAAP